MCFFFTSLPVRAVYISLFFFETKEFEKNALDVMTTTRHLTLRKVEKAFIYYEGWSRRILLAFETHSAAILSYLLLVF